MVAVVLRWSSVPVVVTMVVVVIVEVVVVVVVMVAVITTVILFSLEAVVVDGLLVSGQFRWKG